MPGRVASLTMLNTLVEVDTFKRPWSIEPFDGAGSARHMNARYPSRRSGCS
jgi:hypothetical protein